MITTIFRSHDNVMDRVTEEKTCIYNWWATLTMENKRDMMVFLSDNYDNMDWSALSSNVSDAATSFLLVNPDKINWENMCLNESAGAMVILSQSRNYDKIVWTLLSQNKSSGARELLIKNFKKISWPHLCLNETSWAVDILSVNRAKIDPFMLCYNNHPEAVILMKERFELNLD